uniref:Uncharacterized protein n=1 Tax=Knipowitschia caucasica TaxID=637954 RepID=A0AAV2KEX7_KNICA
MGRIWTPTGARVPPKAEERLTTSSSPPGVSESRGRPDHPIRFSWDHSLGSPSRFPQVPTRHRVPVERLGEEAEERERERQATMELQYRLKKLEIEAETALKIRRLELEAEGRLPLNPSRVVAAVEPAHSPVQPVDLVPEAYRQRFRGLKKAPNQTYFHGDGFP